MARCDMGIAAANVAYAALAIAPSKLAACCRARAALSLDLEVLFCLDEKAHGPSNCSPASMREVYKALANMPSYVSRTRKSPPMSSMPG